MSQNFFPTTLHRWMMRCASWAKLLEDGPKTCTTHFKDQINIQTQNVGSLPHAEGAREPYGGGDSPSDCRRSIWSPSRTSCRWGRATGSRFPDLRGAKRETGQAATALRWHLQRLTHLRCTWDAGGARCYVYGNSPFEGLFDVPAVYHRIGLGAGHSTKHCCFIKPRWPLKQQESF